MKGTYASRFTTIAGIHRHWRWNIWPADAGVFIWMLVDAIKNPRLDGSQRIIWVLVIVLLPCLGSIIYYFAGRSK
jgi:hypothetical protein